MHHWEQVLIDDSQNWCKNIPTLLPPELGYFQACVLYLCRKDNVAGPRMLSLRGLLALGWHLGTWVWEGFLPFSEPIKMVHWAQTVQIWFMLSACFPSKNLEFWYVLSRVYLGNQLPIKSLDTESLTSFLGGQHSARVVNSPEEWGKPCVPPTGGDSQKHMPGFH